MAGIIASMPFKIAAKILLTVVGLIIQSIALILRLIGRFIGKLFILFGAGVLLAVIVCLITKSGTFGELWRTCLFPVVAFMVYPAAELICDKVKKLGEDLIVFADDIELI